jgi:Mce-associated membrane protein
VSLRPIIVRVAAVVVAIAAVAVAGVERHHADQLAAQAAVRREVARTAGRFGEALLSYDYAHLDQARARLARDSTKRFADQYNDAFNGGLGAAINGLKATSTASVRDVYVDDVDGRTAHAIVTVDSEVHSTTSTRRTVGSYLDMTLLRSGGRWKVDAVISVASLDQQTTPAGGAGAVPAPPDTTPTTAP